MLPRSEPAPLPLCLDVPQTWPTAVSPRGSISQSDASPARSPGSSRALSSPSDSPPRERRTSGLQWITVSGQSVPVVDSFDYPAPAMRWSEPSSPISAHELCLALHEQAPERVAGFTERFARDVGFDLCVLHHQSKRAYLGLELRQVRFEPPASFRLLPFSGERALGVVSPSEDLSRGVAGYAPEEQRNQSSRLDESGLVATDTFSWAATVAAFAIGEPLVPVLQANQEPAPWVKKLFLTEDFELSSILQSDEFELSFCSHYALDAACQLLQDAYESDREFVSPGSLCSPNLDARLAEFGPPWLQLRASLGPLFAPLLPYFELIPRLRPPLSQMLHLLRMPPSSSFLRP